MGEGSVPRRPQKDLLCYIRKGFTARQMSVQNNAIQQKFLL